MGNIDKQIDFVRETYTNEDVCMAELLDNINVNELPDFNNLTIGDIVWIYTISIKWAEGDTFYRKFYGSDEMEEL